MQVLSVAQLNRYVKSLLEEDRKLQPVFLRGEISSFHHHSRSGHCYFTLQDREASVRAVMFRGQAEGLSFQPEDGMQVVVRATVSLYEREGSFQIYVSDLIPEGEGTAAVALRQRRERLAALGVFDLERKRQIPRFPETVGIVTSENGAAIGDMLRTLESRCPAVKVLFAPAQVQGEEAPESLVMALQALDGCCDVILIGRGGGSSEDLSAFNDEALAMAVFRCATPVISAVGHEQDHTICDLAADLRVPTPTAAAQAAVPSRDELLTGLGRLRGRMAGEMLFLLDRQEKRLAVVKSAKVVKNPQELLKIQAERLSFLRESLYNKQDALLRQKGMEVARLASVLDSLSPLRVLSRGYSLVERGEQVVSSVHQLEAGDKISVRFSDGIARAIVDKLEQGN